ncbi:MAG: InlB B-repeat-containing protein [Bacilli bacterium]|nr:InlB B-repeat-containing protein [Bacilli bacterium]MDD4808839.1 InlB B-repeat-containing protein [Bacilli bacterium]
MMENKKIVLSVITLVFVMILTGCGFQKKEFDINFSNTGDSNTPKVVIDEDGKLQEPEAPIKEGYRFLYWEMDGEEYDFDEIVNQDIKLVAKWEKIEDESDNKDKDKYKAKTYEVSFDSLGGTGVSNQAIKETEKAKEPTVPTKEGYKFLYWQLDGKEYNFNTIVTKDIKLVAKWEKVEEVSKEDPTPPVIVARYLVTFDSTGGSKVSSIEVIRNKTVAKPTTNPTRSGYRFIGWLLNGTTYDFNTPVTKSITLTAKWEQIIIYTVTIEELGIDGISMKVIVKKNGTVINALEALDSNGVTLGKHNQEYNVILVHNKYTNNIAKIKLNDGTIVNVSK